MSALTFVLTEIPGMDADEFRNVRSYHSCGKSYQEALKNKIGRVSPVSTKSSSGVSSLSDEEIPKPEKLDFFTNWESVVPSRLESEKRFSSPKVIYKNIHRIMYRGRNILNLERNMQPHKWQLTSPVYGFHSKYSFCGEYYRFEGFTLLEEYKMKTCNNCGYYEPTPYLEE